MQMSQVMLKGLALGILNQPLADREGATTERHSGDAVPFDILELRLKVVEHVGDIEWCADGHDRLRLRHAMCSSQHGGPAQRVPDDDGRRSIVLPQVIRSAN